MLSDPQPNKEAYVPLTPAYFSHVLEDAIRHMVREMAKMKGPDMTLGSIRSVPFRVSGSLGHQNPPLTCAFSVRSRSSGTH